MGQLQSKEQRHNQIRRIVDRVFDYFSGHSGNAYVTFQELYTAILIIYNDINKHFPGPHYDPPSREEVQEILKTFDTNQNGVLDREEFSAFIEKFTSGVAKNVGRNLIIFTIAAPALAIVTKRATENVPGVGKVVRKFPNALFASLVTATVILLERLGDKKS